MTEEKSPTTTYRGIIKEALPSPIAAGVAIVGAYAVFSVVVDGLFLVHLYATELWFVDLSNRVEPWMIPVDMGLWSWVLYKCWGYSRD